MVRKSFALTVEGKTYQVEVVRPGVIAVDGHVFDVEMAANGVVVDGNKLVASLSEDFGIVGGVLYDTAWKVE